VSAWQNFTLDTANTLSFFSNVQLSSRPISELMLDSSVNALAVGSQTLGWEIMQFTTATLQADGSYIVSGLVRGNNARAVAHAAGEIIVVLDKNTLAASSVTGLSKTYEYNAVSHGGTSDSGETEVITTSIAGVIPMPPVACSAVKTPNGDTLVRFSRQSLFPDGLAFSANGIGISVAVYMGNTFKKEYLFPTETSWNYTSANKTSDGVSGTLTYRITAYSTFGKSVETIITE